MVISDGGAATEDFYHHEKFGPFIREHFTEGFESMGKPQQQEIGYAEFVRRIMRAGCARYLVFFGGRKAMYLGRNGEFYTEPFPGSAQQ